MDKLLKLNLGCGHDIKAGYVNVDIHSYGTPGVIMWDMADYLVSLPDVSASEVVMRDCLDCLPHGWVKENGGAVVHTDVHPTALEVLHQVKRVLVPGGTAYVRVLNAEHVIDQWVACKDDPGSDKLVAFHEFTRVLLGELPGSLRDGRHSLWNVDELTRVLDIVYFAEYRIERNRPNLETWITR
jgi:hypothetical protein